MRGDMLTLDRVAAPGRVPGEGPQAGAAAISRPAGPPARPAPAAGWRSDIDGLRAVAVGSVVLFHLGQSIVPGGFAGVDVFFVISGFIMVYSTVDLFGKAGAPSYFLVRRLVRIVPLYWLFTTAYVLITVRAARHVVPRPYSLTHFVASYLFSFCAITDPDGYPVFRPGWTLNYEMFFYVCFAATLLLARRRAVTILTAAFASLVAIGVAGRLSGVSLPWPLDYWTNTDLLEFVLGMWIAQAFLAGYRLPRPVAAILAAAALVAIVVTSYDVDDWFSWRGFVWGPLAAMLMAAAVLHETEARGPIRRFFLRLGDASYSLYLVHTAFFLLAVTAIGRFMDPHRIAPLPYAALLLFGSVGLAFPLYYGVERPITRLLNRWLDPSRPGASRPRKDRSERLVEREQFLGPADTAHRVAADRNDVLARLGRSGGGEIT